ncbi:MAG: tetratricopeptide repeat protein [Candidatus Omnitrophota bacterium]
MKRKILICLIPVFVIALAGCESQAFKAERQMWKAHKKAEAIYKNPKGTPPYVLKKAVSAYEAIGKKYPDSLFAVQSQFSIGHLYLVMGDFDRARSVYKSLAFDCDKKGNLCAEAYFAIGKSYELQGNWPDAELIYRKIMQEFPFSAKSLDLPLYMMLHYKNAKDTINTQRTVNEAVGYYKGLMSDERGKKGADILHGLVTRSYLESDQWPQALDSLEEYVRDFPDQNPEEAIYIKAVIYQKKLNDKDKAKAELQRILKDYPDSKLTPHVKSLLERI